MHVALPPRAVWASAGAASFYGISAVSLAFANKAILSGYGWKESNAMLTLQMVVAAAAVQLLAALRLVDLQPLSLSRARTLLPVAFLYASNTAFALASLDGLSLPMYTTLKRMTPAFVLAADAARGKPAGRSTVAAVAVTLLGCVAAGAGDLAFDPKAYAMGTASCALQTAYLVCVASARSGLSSWDLLLYNSLLSAPLLALLCAANGEAGRAAATLPLRLGSFGFAATFGACLVLGVCLNYSIFLCTRLNSALTTTLVGVMKGVLVTVLGFAVYGTASVTSLQLFGIALNTAGGCWYTAIEYRDKSARAAAAGSAGGGAAGAADAAAAAAAAAAVAAEEAASPRPAAAASEQQQQHGGLASPRDELIVGPMSPSRVADHLRHRAGP